MKRIFLLALILSIYFSGFFKIMAQDVSITLDITNLEQMQILYISDLDILKQGRSSQLFQVGIHNESTETIQGCILKFEFIKDNTLVAEITTTEFDIPPGHYFFTNDQLQDGQLEIDGQSIDVEESRFGEDDINEFKQDVLSSGKAPAGRYELRATIIKYSDNNPIAHDIRIFTLTNPSYIQLVSPGSLAGSGIATDIYTEFPMFQWNGNGEKYQVLVFEKKSSLQSLDDILNTTPNWESEPDEDPLSSLSVQYPGSGNIPLEFGKTYYWLIKMFIQTSVEEEKITSEIWQFRLIDPTNLGNQQAFATKDDLLAFLRELLGSRADEIAKRLDGYYFKSMRVNGQPIQADELNQILNPFRQQQVDILDLMLMDKGR